MQRPIRQSQAKCAKHSASRPLKVHSHLGQCDNERFQSRGASVCLGVPSMYTTSEYVYIRWYPLNRGEGTFMATARNRSHKHFQLDSVKIKRAQKALRAKTETETIERALDLAIAEHESNRLALEASERFIKSGIDIKDVYGTLGG